MLKNIDFSVMAMPCLSNNATVLALSQSTGKVVTIIASGGTGRRMGGSVPKQLLEMGHKPVLIHTLLKFDFCNLIDEIILTAPAESVVSTTDLLSTFDIQKVTQVVAGGKERQETVANALDYVDDSAEIVLVHDGVRPFVTELQIKKIIEATRQYGATILAAPSINTIKRVQNGLVVATLDRSHLWQVQTPQGFRADWIKNAYGQAIDKGISATDDASLVEAAGYPVFLVEGDHRNIKITTPLDLKIAEVLLEETP